MKLISEQYFEHYRRGLGMDLKKEMEGIDAIELNTRSFTFYTSVAVISSTRIEGEVMEVDSYVKHKILGTEYLPELVEKPNDLYQAYLFARDHSLTEDHFLQSHALLSEHLLPRHWRGVYRKNEMLVLEHQTGGIQYEAAGFRIVPNEMSKLWEDIDGLVKADLSLEAVFYYASFIHLAFVAIHPFNDGNGRAGRLLEKWFLSEKLGERAWFIPSERYYYEHVDQYYRNLNRLGMFYDLIDYERGDLFLLMLPRAIVRVER